MTSDSIPSKILIQGQGRNPWYRTDGSNCESYIIGVAGGSASGKTSVADRIIRNLAVPWVVILSMDSFYKALTPEQKAQANENNYNFDHPDAFDHHMVLDTLKKMKAGQSVEIPIYDFKTHSRSNKTQTIYGGNVVVFEGIFSLWDSEIMALMDLKIFVDTDSDLRLARRLRRDICERNRDMKGVLQQYERFVKPSFDDFVYPTIRNANVIIPRGLDNTVAIDLVTKHIRRQLEERALRIRTELAKNASSTTTIPRSATLLKQSKQLHAMHTILRDRDTPRDEFLFFSERVARLIIEKALGELPFAPHTVTTPTGDRYHGVASDAKVCGVSILRAGSAMEESLRRVLKEVPIGKILIQSDRSTGEPQLHYCKLPAHIRNSHVLLMDATIATGAAAMMAIRVILDHDVPEENIIFLTYLATYSGLHAIARAFPRVQIITSAIDPDLSLDRLYIEPGMGNFGDRYFGTEDHQF